MITCVWCRVASEWLPVVNGQDIRSGVGQTSNNSDRGIGESTSAIRLVAIDLDGTLLDDSKQVSEQTIRALCGLPERGVRVVIASARPPRSVRHIYRQLKLDTWQVNYNGALIWDEPNAKAVFHQPLPGELVYQIIHNARAEFPQVLVSCEILDRWYTDRLEQDFTTETGRMFKPDVICPAEEFCGQDITKLLLLGQPLILEQVAEVITQTHGKQIAMVQTEGTLLQIMDKRVSKAAAVRKVAQHYGIPLEQVMAIGDAPNDVGMLQQAGVAVAMDNAHPRVKQEADWIAPSNNDHGVHAALVKYGLCEE